MGVLICLAALTGLVLSRNIVSPVKKLQSATEKIVRGDLDFRIERDTNPRCWEIGHEGKRCNKKDCPAYEKEDIPCWHVVGTRCAGFETQAGYAEKIGDCRKCAVYKKYAGDELQQLGDSFNAMTIGVKDARSNLEEKIRTATEDLKKTNIELESEITERKRAEEELKKHREHLEELVKERTAELKTVNERLEQDITRRKQAEEALRESEERVKTILDSVQTGIVVIDTETYRIVDANLTALKMIGASEEEVVGSGCHKYLCPDEKGECPITDPGQTAVTSEQVLLKADGNSIPVLKTAVSVMLGGRKHLIENFVDISEHKQWETMLQKERDFVSAIIDTAGGLVVVFEAGGRIVRFNQTCEEITGYSFDEVKGKFVWDLFVVPEEMEMVINAFEELQAGQLLNKYDSYWITKDGSRRLIAWSNTVLFDNEGSVEYIISTGVEITDRKQVEETSDSRKRTSLSDIVW